MSLYDDLGVSPDADQDAIRAAHRKAAKKLHPDAPNGDAEAFHKVQNAYLILRDPVTRKNYDETGSEEKPINRDMMRISQMIVTAFTEAMQSANGDFDKHDLIAGTVRALNNQKAQCHNGIGQLSNQVDAIEKMLKRLSYKGDGDDLIGSSFASVCRDAKDNIAREEETLALLERAIIYAADYSYEFDPPPPMQQPQGMTIKEVQRIYNQMHGYRNYG